MAAVALILLLGATGGKVADEIKSRRFVVVDNEGRQRAFMTVLPDGRATLVLFGKHGKGGGGLGVGADGSTALVLRDRAERPRLGLGVLANGSPNVALGDEHGMDRLRLHLGADGSPHLLAADKDGKVIWNAVDEECTPPSAPGKPDCWRRSERQLAFSQG